MATDDADMRAVVKQLMANASPEEQRALLDALLDGSVSSILRPAAHPAVRPIPDETRGSND